MSAEDEPSGTTYVAKWLVFLMSLHLAAATHWPGVDVNRFHNQPYADLYYHFIGYAVATWIVIHLRVFDRRRQGIQLTSTILVPALIMAAFAVLDEITQPFFGRNFGIIDLMIDWTASAIAATAYLMWTAKAARRARVPS